MMALALVFIIGGLVTCFGAFVFAVINMSRSRSFDRFDSIFKGHLGAMVAMALGGMSLIFGLILLGINILPRIFK
jgi:cell division protein FtsX